MSRIASPDLEQGVHNFIQAGNFAKPCAWPEHRSGLSLHSLATANHPMHGRPQETSTRTISKVHLEVYSALCGSRLTTEPTTPSFQLIGITFVCFPEAITYRYQWGQHGSGKQSGP